MSPSQASRTFALGLASIIFVAAVAVGTRAADQQQTTPPPLVSLTSGTPQELEKQGDTMRSQKRYLDAIDYYAAAIKLQPTALLWNKEGIALLFLTRQKDAQKCFEQ